MGVFDKLKNALFEEEYVEVEEKPKKPKKSKIKEEKKKDKEKPIAKKIVLPEKKEKIETLEEEELNSNDFEFRPKDDIDKNELMDNHKDFKVMDEDDFKVEDESITDDGEELKIVPVVSEDDDLKENKEIPKEEPVDDFPFKDKDDKFNSFNENDYSSGWNDNYKDKVSYVDDLNSSKDNYSSYSSSSSRGLYGIDNSTQITMHKYGTYERKEEKTYFKPSPIISPIYGILDRNYKKEDVIPKREVKTSVSFEREKVSIDDIRRKAYGSISDDLEKEFIDNEPTDNEGKFEVKEENLLVDLNDDKPAVKEVTMGDAVEYFEDLGLEYNVDYVDEAKKQEKKTEPVIEEVKKERRRVDKEQKEVEQKPDEVVVPERKNDNVESVNTKEEKDDDNDNLFDLIDSMYQE